MNTDPLSPIDFDYVTSQHTLNLDKVGIMQPIASGLHRTKFEVVPGFLEEEMFARLSAYVLSEHLAADTVEESTEVPETWWDHFKHDLREHLVGLPNWRFTLARPVRWWLWRHLPKYRKITLAATWTRNATRPMSTIAVEDKRLGPVVYQEAVTSKLWKDPDERS